MTNSHYCEWPQISKTLQELQVPKFSGNGSGGAIEAFCEFLGSMEEHGVGLLELANFFDELLALIHPRSKGIPFIVHSEAFVSVF